jgi:hypothetical protein
MTWRLPGKPSLNISGVHAPQTQWLDANNDIVKAAIAQEQTILAAR